MSFYCYLLCTTTGSHTYVGATTDPDRRLEQHNGQKAGGARATGIQVERGAVWRRVCVIEGIPEWRSALQIEWRWKQLGRQNHTEKRPLARRLLALHQLLSMEKPTQTAIPYEAYPDGPPRIRWELPSDEALYQSLTGSMPGRLASDPIPSCPVAPSVSNEIESILPVPSFPSPPHVCLPHPDEKGGVNQRVEEGIEVPQGARRRGGKRGVKEGKGCASHGSDTK